MARSWPTFRFVHTKRFIGFNNEKNAIFLASCVALAGCHSQSDPTNVNFSVAIQAYLDPLPGACVGSPAQTIPFSLSKQDSGLGGSALVRARGLEAAGLITSGAAAGQGGGGSNADLLNFSLTDEGKKYFSRGWDFSGILRWKTQVAWNPERASCEVAHRNAGAHFLWL